ncbi:hypothetical protein F2Q69_00056681 [Brassica cretica]|uniref:ABC transporter domain-containing protein n=1 Tax=Brassica cretica TaxID=69181 RepID=A0A8S9MZ07_BRACR|nr:hypothetical protein F2Q69_00056681 [Brassica cretica]
MTKPQIAGDENGNVGDEEVRSQWAAIERLPTFERITTALFWSRDKQGRRNERRVMDVSKLEDLDRHLFIDELIRHVEDDNLRLLQKIKNRIDQVGLELPTIEVRFSDLFVEAECEVVYGKPIPTLWNAIASRLSRVMCLKKEKNISILNGVSGIVRPKRMTLLLGPPSCGKTSLLLALAGRLDHSLKTTGNVSYNGHLLSEFVPEKTSNYVSQNDLHIPDITVRETLDFSGCFQGTGSRLETMKEISRREKLKGIVPDPDIDAYMKAASIEGSKTNLQTDYILKILGLSLCADTRVGDTSRPGISGGQKRRLTTGETIVGPIKTLFMDEISNGLDSSTTFQIVSCLRHYALLSEGTIVVSLLQPAPETFELFDDVILMGEGKIIYIGPRDYICRFFEDCGFKCPTRKSVAEFLQEVISRKDQEQYWCHIDKPYCYVSIDSFIERFKKSELGLQQQEEFSKTHDKSQAQKDALCSRKYSLSNWEMLKACSRREFLLMKRNSFVYVFKSGLLICIGSITMTVYLRTGSKRDLVHANYLMVLVKYYVSVAATCDFLYNSVYLIDFFLSVISASKRSRAIVSGDDNTQSSGNHIMSSSKVASQSKNALSFKPLTFTFQDVCYFVQTPQGKKVQLLSNVTGAFKPAVLTALMGVSGAGKTTLMDVLSGRKSRGDIEGDIQVGGYRKVQETFARVSGYCEQFDIHSPNLTIEESLEYSAWLRLPSSINSETKRAIVREVLETIELEEIKDSIVGLPGVSGLTTEQRKRLTIAVELVANPSIIFMDEPTTGLDARAAAIVMRAVKNITETGRTVACTIHQPGTDIFEAFDELVLMKNGGRIIYHGPLGQHSSNVIEYFMRIPGVPKMKENTNPATWLLGITSRSSEDKLGVDLAQIYKESSLFKENNIVMRVTSSETEELTSSTRYAQTGWEQFKACLWKQHLSYWRNPSYNLTRILFMCLTSLIGKSHF